jgi:hypothetical protein
MTRLIVETLIDDAQITASYWDSRLDPHSRPMGLSSRI